MCSLPGEKDFLMSVKQEDTGTLKNTSLTVPSLTVFVTSFCIMVLELVAGRLIARHLGSSLYTWTSVIGVVLTGITIGNYLGGRIADRFDATKALAGLLGISSIACVSIVVLNNLTGQWRWLWMFNWPMRVFTHVALMFLLPSTLLGMVTPVVAKMALDKGLATGRTVGNIYACGAAGSIAGTFAAGFFLISTIGTTAIIWIVAAILLLMAVLYWKKARILHLWAIVFVALITIAATPSGWAAKTGTLLALRKNIDPKIIYEDESQYCYIAVKKVSEYPDVRKFLQDKLKHSEIAMDDISDLRYFYAKIYAAVTEGLSAEKKRLSTLNIGGGGYVFPRYLQSLWPKSRIDVAEIDPSVTEAAIQAFGLDRNTEINTFTMDARNYVDQLLQQEQNGKPPVRYDFIYEDAFNNYSVPYQLTTFQFNEKLHKLLTDDGVYMINMIDMFDSGLFLGAIINTLEKTFPFVYAVTRKDLAKACRNTYVVIAAKKDIDVQGICQKNSRTSYGLWHLDEDDLQILKNKTKGLILTDDYAPVENLISPAIRADAIDSIVMEYFRDAQNLAIKGDFDAALGLYRKIIDIDPTKSVRIYNEAGMVLLKQKKWAQAAQAFENSLNYIEKENLVVSTGAVRWNLASALKESGKFQLAREQLDIALEQFRAKLEREPRSAPIHLQMAKIMAALEKYDPAGFHFLQAVNINPLNIELHIRLVDNLRIQGKTKKAIDHLNAAILFISKNNEEVDTTKLKQYLQTITSKQSKDTTL